MPLSRPIPPDLDATVSIRPQFASAAEGRELPRDALPDGEMPPDVAYQVVHDELMLDGRSRLNLATFVTTWMEPRGADLVSECLDKNVVDKDEYPQTAELEARCVRMLAGLWNADRDDKPIGCSTTGSSEACMLAGMALHRRWRARRRAAGLPTDSPNLVMGANVQVCWEKYCRYWDIEPRMAPVSAAVTHLSPEAAVAHCDENTIGVVSILGSTFDGTYEPVQEIAAALDEMQRATGVDVPMHVDAASGGFVAPFLEPDLIWDFRLPRVQSINASGHKFGLVYPGVGWAIWRAEDALPEELIFKVDYLGGDMPTFALNFSRPGAQVIAQYYNLIRLGRDGYYRVQQACRDTALRLSEGIAAIEPFQIVADGSELPVLAWRLPDDFSQFSVYDVSAHLRAKGWLVPAYPMPPAIEDVHVLRVVVRNGFGRPLAEHLLRDLADVTAVLREEGGRRRTHGHPGFHH